MAENEAKEIQAKLLSEIRHFIKKHSPDLPDNQESHLLNELINKFFRHLLRHHLKETIFDILTELSKNAHSIEEQKFTSHLRTRINCFHYSPGHSPHHRSQTKKEGVHLGRIIGFSACGITGITLLVLGITYAILTAGEFLPILSAAFGALLSGTSALLFAFVPLVNKPLASISPTSSTNTSMADTYSSSARSSISTNSPTETIDVKARSSSFPSNSSTMNLGECGLNIYFENGIAYTTDKARLSDHYAILPNNWTQHIEVLPADKKEQEVGKQRIVMPAQTVIP